MKIRLFSDGTILADGGGAFGLVPRSKWAKLLPPDADNLVPQVLWTPLIEADGKLILVDCGAGDKHPEAYINKQPHRTLLQQLNSYGVAAGDIDLVIFTHMHGDHIGWATEYADSKRSVLRATFPNAVYIAQRAEFDDASHPNERTRNTYLPENFELLQRERRLLLLDGDVQISKSVRCVVTPGHTAGHQSLILDDGSGQPPIFLLGDLATFAVQFARLPWVTAYDVLPMVTIETKRKWQQWALEQQAVCVFAHEPDMPIARLKRSEATLLFSVQATQDSRIKLSS